MSQVHLTFVTNLDERNASYRFRLQKLLPLLRQAGLTVSVVHYRIRAEVLFTVPLFLALKRYAQLQQIVVFQRQEAFALARVARAAGATVLLDIDDGSYEHIDGSAISESERLSLQRWLKSVDGVVASTPYLADWIRPWNHNLFIVPTCLNADNYAGLNGKLTGAVTIGWVGGPSCQVVLETIDDTLVAVTRQTGAQFLVVGPYRPSLNPELEFEFVPWTLAIEPAIYGQFDIGINPMPENERTKMKAGFKMLQYMAAGLPVVSSPVGINKDIIEHGVNGLLATTVEEWKEYLCLLINNPALRHRMGQAARHYVQANYTLHHAASQWLQLLEEAPTAL